MLTCSDFLKVPKHSQVFEGLSDPRVQSAETVLVHLERPLIERQSITVLFLQHKHTYHVIQYHGHVQITCVHGFSPIGSRAQLG